MVPKFLFFAKLELASFMIHVWRGQHQVGIGMDSMEPESVRTALGQNWCREHWVTISTGDTRPQLVLTAQGQNWCG